MELMGGEIVRHVLEKVGIEWVFGIPGVHNLELYDGLLDSEILKPTLITDEQSAAFMADGAARASGKLAAVNLVPGAGATHALSGIAEAYLDQIPMLVLMCGIRGDTGKAYQLHAVDQAAIVRPVVKKLFQPKSHQELHDMLMAACELAGEPPHGPVAVEAPAQLYLFKGTVHADAGGGCGACCSCSCSGDTGGGLGAESVGPERLKAAAELLNRSQRVGLYIGSGAIGAADSLRALADRLDAIVFTTISAKGIFPEDHPRWGWNVLGRSAPPEILKIEKSLDCLLAIGCRFAEVPTGCYGCEFDAPLIHVDIDPDVLGRNYPAELKIDADAEAFVRTLLKSGLLRDRGPSGTALGSERVHEIAAAHESVRAIHQSQLSKDRVSPIRLYDGVRKAAGPEAIYVVDSGNGLFLTMEHLRLNRPRSFLAPVDYSCMGYSVPAAIGAKLACAERPVAAFVGDGAFLMTGAELATAAARQAGVVIFLLRDGELSQIAQFQDKSLKRRCCVDLPEYDASSFAQATGAEFLRMDSDSDVEGVSKRAFELAGTGKPVLVEVRIDYSHPTFFSQGVVKTNFLRVPIKDKVRLVSRYLKRSLF